MFTKRLWAILATVVVAAVVLAGGAFFLLDTPVEALSEPSSPPALQGQTTEADVAEIDRADADSLAAAEMAQAEQLQRSASNEAPASANQSNALAMANSPQTQNAFIYSGDVAARDIVPVAVEIVGQALSVNVEVGDRVQAGKVLLQIDSTTLEAQRAQAVAGLQAAQAGLDQVFLGADASAVNAAQAAVAAANEGYQRVLEGPTSEDLRIAEASVRQAEAAVRSAQAAYNQVKGNPAIGMLPQSMQLEQATLAYEAAKAQYEKAVQGATSDAVAGAYAQVASAQAQLDNLQTGAKRPQIQAAEAQVSQAETGLYLAQLQVDKATVTAPIDGIISQVNVAAGANVAPGSPIFQILSDEMEVGIAVEETRRGDIEVGQPATISVNAYPDRTFAGEVALIAPQLDATTRTFLVTVRPTGDASALAPGMFATVELGQ